ncbi:hypothetical protein TNCV_4627181 [Trichonephila clavipes]|nr:hypothetical protein TNCV_4627181 [Trichonephila clavipes]
MVFMGLSTMLCRWDRSEADGTCIGHLKHGIGPILPITPIRHHLSQLNPGARVWGPCSVQAFVTKLYSLGLPMAVHTAWIKAPFPFPSTPVPSNRGKGLQVPSTHKARAKESPGGQDVETADESFQPGHCGSESNNLGRLQGVYMGSKQHHKLMKSPRSAPRYREILSAKSSSSSMSHE